MNSGIEILTVMLRALVSIPKSRKYRSRREWESWQQALIVFPSVFLKTPVVYRIFLSEKEKTQKD